MVTYADLGSDEEFQRASPLRKVRSRSHLRQQRWALTCRCRAAQVPAFIRADGESVFESAVILGYLEDKYSALRPAFVQETPEQRQRMELIMRCHDVYVASPNCTAPGFSHTQGNPPPSCAVRALGSRPAALAQARCTCPSASTALLVGWI